MTQDEIADEIKLVRARRDNFRTQAESLRGKAERAIKQAEEADEHAAREANYLKYLEAQLQTAPLAPTRMPLSKCGPPCGKIRHESHRAAKQAASTNDKRVRAYYSFTCKCWHVAKRES